MRSAQRRVIIQRHNSNRRRRGHHNRQRCSSPSPPSQPAATPAPRGPNCKAPSTAEALRDLRHGAERQGGRISEHQPSDPTAVKCGTVSQRAAPEKTRSAKAMVDAVTSAIPSVRTLSTERVAVSFGDGHSRPRARARSDEHHPVADRVESEHVLVQERRGRDVRHHHREPKANTAVYPRKVRDRSARRGDPDATRSARSSSRRERRCVSRTTTSTATSMAIDSPSTMASSRASRSDRCEHAAEERGDDRSDATDDHHEREGARGGLAGRQVGDDGTADDHAPRPPRPWKRRAATSTATFGAKTATALAMTHENGSATRGGTRPNRSESGPKTSCPAVTPTRNAVRSVARSWPRSRARSSSAGTPEGRGRSRKGATALNRPSTSRSGVAMLSIERGRDAAGMRTGSRCRSSIVMKA